MLEGGGGGGVSHPLQLTTGLVVNSFIITNCSDRILTCRINSICSPAKVGLVVTDFNYQPGS